ncbi:MAG: hypothetical protein GY941_28825 [Planctomycetes bacterium]|nr:hypothetical protein [Planctomycetota bacterium]
MLDTDKSVTRELKNDINKKNAVRCEIERLVMVVSRWNDNLSKSRSFKEQSKYGASIKRYISKIESLRSQLMKMNDDIDRRICETDAYSSSEVTDFKSRLEKEASALGAEEKSGKEKPAKKRGAKGKAKSKRAGIKGAEKLQKKIAKVRKCVDGDIIDTERVTGRILTLNRRLGSVGRGIESEALTAEERSHHLFTQERKRIERERLVFSNP